MIILSVVRIPQWAARSRAAKAICGQQRRSRGAAARLLRSAGNVVSVVMNDALALRGRIAAHLADFERIPVVRPDLKQASVAVCASGGVPADHQARSRSA
jgi:hypothetical protein